MPRNDFLHSFTWGDYQHDLDRDAQAERFAAQHSGGWCHKCGAWIEGAARGSCCECGGTVGDTTGGNDG